MQVIRSEGADRPPERGRGAARSPHLLFGEVDGAENFSVGRLACAAREILAAAHDRAGPLIFVGGTGSISAP